jgi:hypothetical protein
MGEAARSGMSIREFCRQRRLKESQSYWRQHKLSPRRAIASSRAGQFFEDAAAAFKHTHGPDPAGPDKASSQGVGQMKASKRADLEYRNHPTK